MFSQTQQQCIPLINFLCSQPLYRPGMLKTAELRQTKPRIWDVNLAGEAGDPKCPGDALRILSDILPPRRLPLLNLPKGHHWGLMLRLWGTLLIQTTTTCPPPPTPSHHGRRRGKTVRAGDRVAALFSPGRQAATENNSGWLPKESQKIIKSWLEGFEENVKGNVFSYLPLPF